MRNLFAVLFLAASGAIFFMYTKPAYDGLRVVQDEIRQYDQALDKADELQRLKQSLLSRYNAFNPVDVDRLHKLLPDHVDNVRLVLDLDTLASQHGFALQNVVINAPGTAVNPGSQQQQVIIGPNRETYDSLTLRFGTSGTYPKFVEFINALESSLRLVDVVALAMDTGTTNPEGGGEPTYRFDITLRTYWLK